MKDALSVMPTTLSRLGFQAMKGYSVTGSGRDVIVRDYEAGKKSL